MSAGETGAPLVCIMGPTASGKTGMALALCRAFPLDIISVDSAQVYRGMDIGTAKPDATTLRRAPHRLVDICDPSEAYSAARFCDDARVAIREIHAAGRVPLLVGGTMLYFKALLEGLADLPDADPELRAAIELRAQRVGWPALHRELAQADPSAAARIEPGDQQRIQRALEVHQLTGRPITELQAESRAAPPPWRVLKLVLCPEPRAELHRRIELRFDQMLAEGFVDEVRALRARENLGRDLPAMRAVGYRQAWDFLDGRVSEAEWRDRAIAATRQFAKRQLTWLRREKGALWYDSASESAEKSVFSVVGPFLQRKG